MRLYIFADNMIPELRERSSQIRSELPDVLQKVNKYPAEVAETRVDAILSLIGLIQRYKCDLSIWSEDGTRQDHLFF